MICKSCGAENDDDRIYCIACMGKLKNKCIKCEEIYDLSLDECPKCKTKSIKEIKVNTNSNVNVFTLIFPLVAMIFSAIILLLLNNIEYKTLEVVNGNTYGDTKGLIDSLSYMLALNITSIISTVLSAVYIMFVIKKGYVNIYKIFKDIIFASVIAGFASIIMFYINVKNESIYKASNFNKSYIYGEKGIVPLIVMFSIMFVLLIASFVFEIIFKNNDKFNNKNN